MVNVQNKQPFFTKTLLKHWIVLTTVMIALLLVTYLIDYNYEIVDTVVENGITAGAHSRRMLVPADVLTFVFAVLWVVGLGVIALWHLIKGPTYFLNRSQRSTKRGDYSKLRIKFLSRMVALLFAVFLFLIFIYSVFLRGRLADSIITLTTILFRMEYDDALLVYNDVVRGNADLIMIGAMAVCFLILLRFMLKAFTRYFDDIDAGIDKLLIRESTAIELRPEMLPLEKKLNTVRQTLEKRELEAKLADQRKNELIVYLAHDLKTPLTSIIGYLSLMDEAPDMSIEQKAKYTRIALEKAQRLERLISQFFEISRYSLHEMVIEPEQLDLHYLLLQLTDEFYPLLSSQNKTIDLSISEDLWIEGDAEKLARVFNNILRNALAYSSPDSLIEISAQQCDKDVVVSFVNQGKTIPDHKLDTIFDKFYRMDDARNTELGGAGLGLAIAKEIVALHRGSITAQSLQGKTTFTVTLPLCSANTTSVTNLNEN